MVADDSLSLLVIADDSLSLLVIADYFFLVLRNDATHNCLDTMGRKSGEELGLSYCHGLGGNQVPTSVVHYDKKHS